MTERERLNITDSHSRNEVKIVGKVDSVDRQREGVTSKGVPYIAGKMVVKSHAGTAQEQLYNVDFFFVESWSSGKLNPQYTNIQNITVGSDVSLSCTLEGNRFLSADQGIINTNRVNINFINTPRETEEEGGTFTINGFIVQELKELRDQTDTLKGYTIQVAQPRYVVEKGLSIVTLFVDPRATSIVDGVRNAYKLNTSVSVTGHINSVIETTEKVQNSLFGEAAPKVTQRTITNFVVDSGLEVPENGRFSIDLINALVEHTKNADEELKSNKKSAPAKSSAAGFNQPSKSSLSNLLGIGVE